MEQWSATQNAPGQWDIVWTPDPAKAYEIWDTGQLLTTTAVGVGTYTVNGELNVPPEIEVFEVNAGALAENQNHPPYLILQWRYISGCSGYRVEHYEGSDWVVVANVTENGMGWYSYRTPNLDDDTSNQYRISALDNRGLAGTPVNYTARVIRNPAGPSVEYSISSGTFTVGAP